MFTAGPASRRVVAAGATAVVAIVTVSGCSGSSGSSGSSDSKKDSGKATTISVTLTPEGCAPSPASAPAGLFTFDIKNKNASAVTEAELLKGDSIVGEKENLAPGLSGNFTLRLKAGSYVVFCPNAKTDRFDFTVTAGSVPASDPAGAPASDTAAAAAASKAYHDYVVDEVKQLVASTATFTAAVKAGNIDAAKARYGSARTHYESVEPVAESFGDLDPAIDARADDVTDPSQWSGFHRIEKALWQDKSLDGMTPVADKLTADIAKLQTLVADESYQPAQIANGSVELLDEVAKSKVTGEEDRYSHTDLYDFEANVNGAKEAFNVVKPLLKSANADLASTIDSRFADVLNALQRYKQGDGWVDYSTVSQDQRRTLAQKVDALAEPLSQVAALVG